MLSETMIYKYGKIVLNKGKDVGFNMYEDEVLLCNVETREGRRETNENREFGYLRPCIS